MSDQSSQPDQVKKSAKKVADTYQSYLDKLRGLREEQEQIVDEVVQRIAEEKSDEIKKNSE